MSLSTVATNNNIVQSSDNCNINSKPIKKEAPLFWFNDPNVLLHRDSMLEFFPVDTMTYEQKLNAISRTVIVLTIISFMLTKNIRILVISAITLFSIFILYFYNEKSQKNGKSTQKEGFNSTDNLDSNSNFTFHSSENPNTNPAIAYLNKNSIPIPNVTFDSPTVGNPFSNVLIPDYDYNVNKKPAPPAYNKDVNQTILTQAKRLVVESNPEQPDIADKLFKDLGDNLDFEQSLRPFNSNPSTTIPNDQAAFADFCYGSMVSCKEGNLFACARNLARHTN